jgi:peptidoglycan hydrolase-like protein with peptidoglycan-binding domain
MAIEGLTSYRGDSDREANRTLQTALTAAGFDTRGIDGIVGNNTRAALAAFAEATGTEVDLSKPVAEIVAHINTVAEARTAAAAAAAETAAAEFGAAGADMTTREGITYLQEQLNANGFNVGRADGIRGPRTNAGVDAMLAGLGDQAPEGGLDGLTNEQLSTLIQQSRTQITQAETAAAEAAATAAAEASAARLAALADKPLSELTREETRELQSQLRDRGLHLGVDGIAGPETRAIEALVHGGEVPEGATFGSTVARADEWRAARNERIDGGLEFELPVNGTLNEIAEVIAENRYSDGYTPEQFEEIRSMIMEDNGYVLRDAECDENLYQQATYQTNSGTMLPGQPFYIREELAEFMDPDAIETNLNVICIPCTRPSTGIPGVPGVPGITPTPSEEPTPGLEVDNSCISTQFSYRDANGTRVWLDNLGISRGFLREHEGYGISLIPGTTSPEEIMSQMRECERGGDGPDAPGPDGPGPGDPCGGCGGDGPDGPGSDGPGPDGPGAGSLGFNLEGDILPPGLSSDIQVAEAGEGHGLNTNATERNATRQV